MNRASEGDHLGNLGKSSLKALTANSEYSSISAEKRNLFEITEKVDNIRLKELSKGINSFSQRSSQEPYLGTFLILSVLSELKLPGCLL